MLRRSPGFTAAAVLTFALRTGATTEIAVGGVLVCGAARGRVDASVACAGSSAGIRIG